MTTTNTSCAPGGAPRRDVERLLAQLAELAPQDVSLTAADGRILLANADLQRLLGHTRAELLGLRQANANLEEFACAASHDLKAPLTGIAALIDWIGEDLAYIATPEVARGLERVGERIRRLEQVVDDLLAYARAALSPPISYRSSRRP